MHVNPEEVRGLSSLRGAVTINPETGLPEAFPWLPILIGAGIGGFGSAVTGGDPLKGAAMGALGGFMPTALGGLAGLSPGLTAAWGQLGSIGQGMLSGAAMGGIRSLFGNRDNPLRDMLFGAAMGGMGGAMFPETVEAAGLEGVELGQAGRESISNIFKGVPASPMITPGRGGYIPGEPPNFNLGASQAVSQVAPSALTDITGAGGYIPRSIDGAGNVPQYFSRPEAIVSQASRQAAPQMYVPRPADVISGGVGDFRLGGGEAQDFGYNFQTGTPSTIDVSQAERDLVTSDAFTAGVGPSIDPPSESLWDKFNKLEPWKQAGMIGGAGFLGLAGLEGQPLQAEIPGLRTAAAIPELDPFTPRTPIGGRGVEFYERTIGEGRTPEEARYFEEEEIDEEDVNVAKEGGIVSLQSGGGAGSSRTGSGGLWNPSPMGLHPAPPGMTYVPGQTPMHGPVLRKTSEVGGAYASGAGYGSATGPTLVKGASVNQYGQLVSPDWERAGDTGAATAAPEPFKFPDVTPFQSSLPSFNLEDRLARITGQPQAALPQQTTLPQQATLPSIPITDTQGASAMENLLSRFQQTAQVDPIAGLVASEVGVKHGGIPELANGGIFEGHVQGRGDGMADQIPFRVMPQTPQDIPKAPDMAVLSTDEYVFPADAVSMIGNGSSNAGKDTG